MAMMPGHNLSSKDQVIVGARVSRSGSPMSQPGDLQGLSQPLATRSTDRVNIVINQEVKDQHAAITVPSIKVQVSLDPLLKQQARPNESVFVFARATSGMPAPLAVKKLTVADLPATVVLDDSMAMMPGHNLSSKQEVIIGARISRSGTPMTQPGDLQGLSGSLVTKATSLVNIVIDEVVKN
jgi:cytochrome c-type biogenesis protein CcmH